MHWMLLLADRRKDDFRFDYIWLWCYHPFHYRHYNPHYRLLFCQNCTRIFIHIFNFLHSASVIFYLFFFLFPSLSTPTGSKSRHKKTNKKDQKRSGVVFITFFRFFYVFRSKDKEKSICGKRDAKNVWERGKREMERGIKRAIEINIFPLSLIIAIIIIIITHTITATAVTIIIIFTIIVIISVWLLLLLL